MTDVNFFLRFSLQRMCGTFGDNQFDSKELLEVKQEYIDSYIAECEENSAQMAAKLTAVYDTSALCGKRVLFIGDSLTQDRLGYRGIVIKAAELYAKSIAVSGATSTDMFRAAYENIRSFKPEIVSLMIGTNDAYSYGGESKACLVGKEEYRRNIRSILRDGKASGAEVIVSTIPPMDEEKYTSTHNTVVKTNSNTNIAEYNSIVREEAKAAGAMLIDLETALRSNPKAEMFEPDGIHLSKAGQLVLAELWIKTITE